MGLFEWLFGKKQQGGNGGYYKSLNAYTPVFTNLGGKLYESELIRSAIDARARHISKLSVTLEGSALPSLRANVKSSPNEWQTWGQFLYRVSTILDNCNSAFIVPCWDNNARLNGFFPVVPQSAEVVESNGAPYLKFRFANGKSAARPFEECGILTKFQYTDDFFGESNTALRPTMNMISMQQQGIEEAIKTSASVRYMAKYSSPAFDDDLQKEQARFTKGVISKAKAGGLLLFPSTYQDIKQVNTHPFIVDSNQMGIIQENVFNYFGVSKNILQNRAIGDEWDAFYEGAIEPFSIQLSDVLTKMAFSRREQATGNRIAVTANRLQYMSNRDKLQMITSLRDRGIFNGDECREMLNLPPLPDGKGKEYMILSEFANTSNGVDTNAEDQ